MNQIEGAVLAVMATEHDALDDVECAQHAGLTVAQAANALRSLARAGYLVEAGDHRGDGSFDGYGIYSLTPAGTRLGTAIADPT